LAYRKPVYITTEVLQQESNIAQQYAKIPQGLAFRVLLPPPSGLPELSLPLLNTSFEPLISSIGKRTSHLHEGLTSITANQVLNLAQYAWMTGRLKEAKAYLSIAEKIKSDNPTLSALQNAILNSPDGPKK